MVEERIAWFAGVDWGSERHQACLLDAQGAIVGEREFPHSGKGLSELADWILCKRDFRYTRWPAGWSVMLASGEPGLSQ